MTETFRRRDIPIDINVQRVPGPREGADNSAADRDYFGNFKKFERTDNMAEEPNRNKGSDWKP